MSASIEGLLRDIAARNGGRLTPQAVVSAARPARSPLHRYFTWDDRAAAAKRRLDEARALIASFEYTVVTTPFVVRAPVFVRDPTATGHEQGYVSTGSLRSKEGLARDVLVREFNYALSALRRAKAVAAALNMTAEVEELHRRVETMAAEVSASVQ